MNDTEILDDLVEMLKDRINPELPIRRFPLEEKDLTLLVKFINTERAEEGLNEKIRREVKKQLKQQK